MIIPPETLASDEPLICFGFNWEWRKYVVGLLEKGGLEQYWDSSAEEGSQGILHILNELMTAQESDCQVQPYILQNGIVGTGTVDISSASFIDVTDLSDSIPFTLTRDTLIEVDYHLNFRAVTGGQNAFLEAATIITNWNNNAQHLHIDWNSTAVDKTFHGFRKFFIGAGDYEIRCQFRRVNANVRVNLDTSRGITLAIY